MTTYYKFLMADGRSPYRFFDWPKPRWDEATQQWRPGDWIEASGRLVPCLNGIHACRPNDLLWWMQDICYALEYDAPPLIHEAIWDETKVYGRRARLVRPLPRWREEAVQWALALDLVELIPELVDPAPLVRETVGGIVARLRESARASEYTVYRGQLWDVLSAEHSDAWQAVWDALVETWYLPSRYKMVARVAHSVISLADTEPGRRTEVLARIGQLIVKRIDPEGDHA